MPKATLKAYTDYPIAALGDAIGVPAPIRECVVASYDGEKYCDVIVSGVHEIIKRGYIYVRPGRFGEVPPITRRQLSLVPKRVVDGYPPDRF